MKYLNNEQGGVVLGILFGPLIIALCIIGLILAGAILFGGGILLAVLLSGGLVAFGVVMIFGSAGLGVFGIIIGVLSLAVSIIPIWITIRLFKRKKNKETKVPA